MRVSWSVLSLSKTCYDTRQKLITEKLNPLSRQRVPERLIGITPRICQTKAGIRGMSSWRGGEGSSTSWKRRMPGPESGVADCIILCMGGFPAGEAGMGCKAREEGLGMWDLTMSWKTLRIDRRGKLL